MWCREVVEKCRLWEVENCAARIQDPLVRKRASACADVSEVSCGVSG